jgi:hypothetical protein
VWLTSECQLCQQRLNPKTHVLIKGHYFVVGFSHHNSRTKAVWSDQLLGTPHLVWRHLEKMACERPWEWNAMALRAMRSHGVQGSRDDTEALESCISNSGEPTVPDALHPSFFSLLKFRYHGNVSSSPSPSYQLIWEHFAVNYPSWLPHRAIYDGNRARGVAWRIRHGVTLAMRLLTDQILTPLQSANILNSMAEVAVENGLHLFQILTWDKTKIPPWLAATSYYK